MVLMIIKGLFRRYERWNPVHPTSGAFWGMGVGIGCGVGWGPGFGPEVIGYVGAGCGVGFSVGITLAGVGIGLPANSLFEGPYNAIVATKKGALDFARFSGLLSIKDAAGDGWNNLAPQISGWQREANGRLSSFNHKHKLDRMVDVSNMKNMWHVHASPIWKSLGAFGGQIIRPGKDLKD